MTTVRGSFPWKILSNRAAINQPGVSWFNAVTNVLTTMSVRVSADTESDPVGIERPSAGGRGWNIVIPSPSGLPAPPEDEGRYVLEVSVDSEGEATFAWIKQLDCTEE